MPKKLGWSFDLEANVKVQQDKLNKASTILQNFYNKYNDQKIQIDTSDIIDAVKNGVGVIKDLYEDGTRDATSWLNIRPAMKAEFEGVLADARDYLITMHILVVLQVYYMDLTSNYQ